MRFANGRSGGRLKRRSFIFGKRGMLMALTEMGEVQQQVDCCFCKIIGLVLNTEDFSAFLSLYFAHTFARALITFF